MFNCDQCAQSSSTRIFVVCTRPSDPTELVSVMWVCSNCTPVVITTGAQLVEAMVSGQTVAVTAQALAEFSTMVEECEAQSGVLFITI